MSFSSVFSIIMLSILLLFTWTFYGDYQGKKKSTRDVIREMTCDAMIIAIILLMTFVPSLGFIAVTPFLSFTLLHLPVLLGAAIGGWKKGLLFGFIFGVSSYINALSSVGFNALFAFPWTAIPPRMVFGLVAGIVFSLIGKLSKKRIKVLYLGLAAAGLTMLHTLLVFGNLLIYYPETIQNLFASTSPAAAGTALTFTVLIVLGMAGEMALAFLIIPPLVAALRKAMPRLFVH